MSPDATKSTDYVLGRIESTLDVIKQTLSEDRLASAQYRTEVRKELKEYNERLHEVEASVKSINTDMAEMKPTVIRLDAGAHQREGAAKFAGWLAKGLQMSLGAIGGIVAYFFSGWLHK